MRKINYLWRLFGTGASFTLFGIGGLVISAYFFLLRLYYGENPKFYLSSKWVIHWSFKGFLFFMCRMGVMRFEVEGLEKTRNDSGCLIIANHPCLIDVVALISIYPRANCIVKRALWQNPFVMNVVRSAGYISSDVGEEAISLAGAALKSGDNLVVFPEGTRSIPNEPLSFKRGASHLALRLNCPIRLVTITMKPTTLTKAERWYQIPASRPTLRLEIGDLLSPDRFPDREAPMSLRARKLTRELQEMLETHSV